MLFKATKSLEPINSGGPVSVVGSLLASSLDETLIVTDINSGERIASFPSDGETISAIAISPDQSMVVAASRSLQLHIWSLETKKKIHTFPKAHESAVLALTIDSTSTLAATGGSEGAVKVWDLRAHHLTHNLKGHAGPISALSFYGQLGSSNWFLASGSEDSKVRVWDLVNAKCIKVWTNHVNTVRSVAWTSKGDALISGGRDKVVSIYRGNEVVATLPVMEEVEATGFVAGHIYTGVPLGLKIWGLDGAVKSEWKTSSDEAEVREVIKVEDNRLLVVFSDQTILDVNVDSESGKISILRTLSMNHGEVIDLQPLEGSTKFAIATNSHEIRLVGWEKPLEFTSLTGHTDIVIAIDVLGRWLVSAGKDKEARLWDTRTGECKLVMTGHTGSIGAVSLSKGNNNLPKFVITGSQDLTIKKWDADGNAEYTRKAHDKDINSVDVSKDNNYFASASQDRTIKIWRVDVGETVGILRGHRRGVWNVKFAPENTVISGSGDKTVRQWSLNDFSCLRTFEGHTNSVLKVVPYINKGNYIASAGGDGLIKIWETRTGESLATLDGHEDKVWALAAETVDGTSQLISGGGDGVIHTWQDYSEEEQERIDKEAEADLELKQDLDNSVRNAEWDKAVKLALKLNHPFRLLRLFKEVQDHQEPDSITGLKAVDTVVANLEEEQLVRLLERVRDWNTTARTSVVAQTILNAILREQPAERLWTYQVMKLFESIQPYNRRHMARTEELLESSYALDYALKEMSMHI